MLTNNQEKFVQGIINGMSQIDAYKSAYKCQKMSDNAIYVEASRLIKNPKVSLRIEELRNKLATPAIMSAQERLEYLTKVVKGEILDGEFEAKIDSKLKAIDLMNKMQGEYVTKVVGNLEAKLEDLL